MLHGTRARSLKAHLTERATTRLTHLFKKDAAPETPTAQHLLSQYFPEQKGPKRTEPQLAFPI